MSLIHHTPMAGTANDSVERSHAAAFDASSGAAAPPVAAGHLRLLERAVTVALSPLDYPDATVWGDALVRALCALAGTGAGAVLLPGAPTPERSWWRSVPSTGEIGTGDSAFATHDESTERMLTPRATAAEPLVFWARDDLAGNGDADTALTRADGSDAVGVRVRTACGAVAAICVYRGGSNDTPISHQLAVALRAIAPAFRAGANTWDRAAAQRTGVARMLDSLADPALLFALDGTLMHANPALHRLTGDSAPARLHAEAQRLAWSIGAVARRGPGSHAPSARAVADASAPSVRDVRLGATGYRLSASIVGEYLLGVHPAVLVTIRASAPEPLGDDDLRVRYALTSREIQTARLLAEGLSNIEIADRLGVRFFTARNHVERTLAKLGVASRHRVGPLLRNELSEQNDPNRASAA